MPTAPQAFTHCGNCASPDIAYDGLKHYACPHCDWTFYHNTASAVAVFLTAGDHTLFVRRARQPGIGLLDLPGGFVDPGESAEHAAAREIQEELAINIEVSASGYLGSLPNVYPYRDVTYHTNDLFYRFPLTGTPVINDPTEILELVYLTPTEVDLEQIALPSIRNATKIWIL